MVVHNAAHQSPFERGPGYFFVAIHFNFLTSLDLKTIDDTAVFEVLFNDFVDIRFVYICVPGLLRINDHDRPQLTAVETASLVNADLALA